jgi:hypothetical protein
VQGDDHFATIKPFVTLFAWGESKPGVSGCNATGGWSS